MLNRKGFTLVEVLVVLLIIGILAAVATPLYLQHAKRARASEAVAGMGLIRQAQRDYRINSGTYFDIALNGTTGNIQNPLPTSVTAGVPIPATAGVDVDMEVTQYFSNGAYSVDATDSPTSTCTIVGKTPPACFANPGVVDFLISVNGDDDVNNRSCEGVGNLGTN